MIDTPRIGTGSTERKRRDPYIPIPANFLTSPRVLTFVSKHGPEALGTLFQIIGFLRNSTGYRCDEEEILGWSHCEKRSLEPLFSAGFIKESEGVIYSPDLIKWMAPLEEILEAKRANGRQGGRPPKQDDNLTKPNVTLGYGEIPTFISSPLLLLDQEGGAGGEAAAAKPEPQPAPEPPKPQAPKQRGMVELLPADPAYGVPAVALTVIEHEQILAHTPAEVLQRAARIVREHWIKKPDKPVKKFAAELSWALVEARKQQAENLISRAKNKRAREGPATVPRGLNGNEKRVLDQVTPGFRPGKVAT